MASKVTTFIVRLNDGEGFATRASSTMAYTHAVVVKGQDPTEGPISWHTTRELAAKTAEGWKGNGYPDARVEPVEARNGAKVTVEKALRAELAEAPAVEVEEAPAKKAPAKAKEKKAPAKPVRVKGEAKKADDVTAMAGYRVHTKSRSTKTVAVLLDGEAQGLDTAGGRWQTICLEHDFIVAHSGQRVARDVLGHPEEWCGPCGKAFQAKA